MPVTLAQAALNVQDDIQVGVIDEFRKSSWLMDNLIFDDSVSPVGAGATLTYGYTRVSTQASAAFRALNAEYTPSEAEKERITVDLKVFGGSYQIDRVLAQLKGLVDEVEFQQAQKIKAASALFNDTAINGDSAIDANTFDGLDKALTGSSTEVDFGSIDLSTSALVTTNFQSFLDSIDEMLMKMDGKPSALLGNTKLIAKIRACARRASAYNTSMNEFGQQVEYYGNTPLVDLEEKPGTNNPVVAIDGATGVTSLYAIRIGMDGFHGVSLSGPAPLFANLPDFTKSGAVKSGDIEMVAAIALKSTKAACVARNIKVQ